MTREEAINKVRQMNLPKETMEILEALAPELKESEDERIRRWLCDYFSSIDKAWIHKDITCIDILRWLEKQKEQKPVDYETELKKCKDNPLYFYDKYVSIKQKPAKWSEDDENMLKDIISGLKAQKLLIFAHENQGKAQMNARIDWLQSLPERFNLQPKEEQSKYDGNMDKECIKLCNTLNSIPSVNTFESCCGHLKDSYSIWFFCNDIITISRLGRCVERNYSDGKWELLVDSTDTHPTGVFWLRSKVPFQSYDEMEESVNELCVCIQYWFNTKFDSYFNDDACK